VYAGIDTALKPDSRVTESKVVFLTNIISHAMLLKDAAMLPDASLQHYGLRGRLKKKYI